FKHLFRFEEFAGNVVSSRGMFRVIGVDSLYGVGDFPVGSKGQKTCFPAVNFTETCFLNDHWPPCREITGAPVAKPAGVESDVLVLGHGELAFGTLDVIAVKPVIDAHLQRATESPAVALK